MIYIREEDTERSRATTASVANAAVATVSRLGTHTHPVRLHGQHLPLTDGGGRDAGAPEGGGRGRCRGGERRDRRLARRPLAGPPRDRRRAAAGDRARGRGAAGPPERLRRLRPADRDGSLESA